MGKYNNKRLPMKLLPITLALITSLCILSPVHAYTVDNIIIEDVIPASTDRPELKLNGASIREIYFLIKSYVGALYLEQPSTNAKEILTSETHQRMSFKVLLRKVGARRIANALQEALSVNISEQEHKKLLPKLKQMLSYFDGTLHMGEEALFDYIPGVGTQVTLKGEVKGVIPGRDYFKAMLSIWIGDTPVGRDFKDDVLGLTKPKQDSTQVADN